MLKCFGNDEMSFPKLFLNKTFHLIHEKLDNTSL